jgi:aryl-alcohol dehydrogenase-like predicted oxidoreductase
VLQNVAERKGATPAQIALAWLLARKPWIVPIPGTRKLQRVHENIGALNVKLSAEDLVQIEDVVSKARVEGERLPEAMLQYSYR